LDFIFLKKDSILKEKYIRKVKKYFYNSGILKKILLIDDIINSDENSSKIRREFVYEYINTNHIEEINNYDLFKDTSSSVIENTLITNTNNLVSSSSNNLNYPCTIPNKNTKKEELISDNEKLVLKTNINNNNNSFFSSKEDDSKSLIDNDQNQKKETNTKSITKIHLKNNKYNNLKLAFNRMASETGAFPIALFEDMLKEINVIQS
jgi:hypothetical protein